MTDLSDIVAGRSGGARVAYLGDTAYDSVDALVAAFPALATEDGAPYLACLVTHFARGDMYAVIEDRAAFQQAYEARLASEDPSPQTYEQNVIRLSDFGAPDYSAIEPPGIEAGALVFFAREAASGLPYKVRVDLSALGTPQFAPMPLTPIDPPEAEPARAPTRSTIAARTTQVGDGLVETDDDEDAPDTDLDLDDYPPPDH